MGSFTNPIVSGLLAAMQLKQAMDHASLQREDLARRKSRDKREDDLQNFSLNNALLTNGAKPVDGSGTYNQAMQVPDNALPFNPANPTPQTTETTRAPIDNNRVLQSPGGKSFYIPTPDE